MKNIILSVLSLILISAFFSCNKPEEPAKDTAGKESGMENNASGTQKEQESKRESEQNNSGNEGESEKKFSTRSIKVKFPAGSTQITLDGNINGFGDNISYEFEVSKGQTLNAFVKPKDGDGNIRINQIISPDGKADGPFGNKITYKLTEAGNWKLIIGEDMMAGEPWKGSFLLTIEIK